MADSGQRETQIIVNPAAGGGKGPALADALARILRREGKSPAVLPTEGRGHAVKTARAAAESGAAVVCVGGDGTVSEVAGGLAHSPSPLVLLPTGTANMLAKEFNIPSDPRAAARALGEGRSLAIDAGRFGERHFVCVASMGFDAETARRYGLARRGTGGYLRYARPFLETAWSFQQPRIRMEIDGQTTLGPHPWVLLSNTRVYGGPLRFTRQASPVDGRLEAVATTLDGPLSTLRYLALALFGGFAAASDTFQLNGRHIRITPLDRPAPTQLDGDYFRSCEPGETVDVTVLPKAVRLLLPGS